VDVIIWIQEIINHQLFVFKRIHVNFIKTLDNYQNLSYIPPNVFNEPSKKWSPKDIENFDGISVDWEKYSSEKETLIRKGKKIETKKRQQDYGIIKMKVDFIRKIEPLNVEHNPIQDDPVYEDNRAHSLITGITLENKEILRIELTDSKTSCWGLQGWNSS